MSVSAYKSSRLESINLQYGKVNGPQHTDIHHYNTPARRTGGNQFSIDNDEAAVISKNNPVIIDNPAYCNSGGPTLSDNPAYIAMKSDPPTTTHHSNNWLAVAIHLISLLCSYVHNHACV